MSVLVDTNVLLRRMQPGHPHYSAAVESVARILAGGEPAHYTLQNVAEFWSALTRPAASNGLGLSVVRAEAEITEIEETLTLLPDVPAIYAEWRRLVTQHAVLGTKVHDARLVAAMIVHGVRRILTFNASDFARYGVEVIEPTAMLA